MFSIHEGFAQPLWFAGGSWKWLGMIPANGYSFKTTEVALEAAKRKGVKHLINTAWGDDGAECSHFSQLPSLFYLAEYAKGNTDEAKIKAKFKSFCGIDFDEFMAIDCPNDVVPYTGRPRNPSKYMLYSDYFNDFLDYTVKEGAGQKYEEYAAQLHATAKKSRRYGYVFDCAAKLCDVLAIKYELGLRTRKAYEAGDKETLKALAENEYVQVGKRLAVYARSFEKQWMIDNKPQGFDVQDMRLGGMIHRTDACRRRILDYVNGKLDRIEELDEKLLPYGTAETSMTLNRSNIYSTVNVMAHMV
jgi:hypothetical protein